MPPTLLLIDVQRNMLEPPQPVPGAAGVTAAIADLLAGARSAGAAVIHVRNNGGSDDPDAPGTRGWELVHDALPGEALLDKRVADAFEDTALGTLLPPRAELVVAGLQSEFCIRATSLGALEHGHGVSLVRGAHATYDGERPAREISLEVERELAAAGARILDPADIVFG